MSTADGTESDLDSLIDEPSPEPEADEAPQAQPVPLSFSDEEAEVVDAPLPVMYEHCCKAYKAMLAAAHKSGEDVIYEGFITALFTQELHLSVPYFSSIRKNLQDMGCIRQLKRGGGSARSIWLLVTEPTEELFVKKFPRPVYGPDRRKQQDQQYQQVINRLNKLEAQQGKIVEFLAHKYGTEENTA
jgi:hypothetical protein